MSDVTAPARQRLLDQADWLARADAHRQRAERFLGPHLRRAGQDHPVWDFLLHANMDLYKWCYKLGPLAESELLFDCLELAAAARELDIRASPYDLSAYGYPNRCDLLVRAAA